MNLKSYLSRQIKPQQGYKVTPKLKVNNKTYAFSRITNLYKHKLIIIFKLETNESLNVLSNASEAALMIKAGDFPSKVNLSQNRTLYLGSNSRVVIISPRSPQRLRRLEYGDDINTNRNIAGERYRLCRFEL